jgi:hypothetical protein
VTDDTALPDPPAANQGKDEPIATSPSESPQSSDEQPAGDSASMPAGATGGVPTPGDSQGVSVPSVQAAAGSSEESEKVQDVRTTALAPPGKPDGEVDTRG